MALADDIQDLGARNLAELDASHDYYTHSRVAWRLLQQTVKQGKKFTARSKATGTVVDQKALVGLAQPYVARYLMASTFQHFVALFENFVFDLLRLWLAAYPGSLSERLLKFGIVLQAPDKAAVTLAVVDKELNDLKYERVADWFEYLEKKAKLGSPTPGEIETLTEIKATRDILVHNKGITNPIYVAKAGNRARAQVGETLDIPEQYHRASWQTIKKVIQDVSDAAVRKVVA